MTEAALSEPGADETIGYQLPAWAIVAALVAIAGVAIALRYIDLGSNPGGLYGDEAAEALDAQRLLHQPGFHPVFFASDGGREALFAYFVAFAFRLGGESALVLRATAAAFGVAGVLAIWLLGRRFGAVAGLAAAAWAGGSLWLICISRDGMRNTIVPLFGALALLAVLVWLERPSRWTAVLAGVVGSIAALYTYQPLKLLPLVVVLWLWWLRRANRPEYERLRPQLGVAGLAFVIVALPMIAVAVTSPANYFGRAAEVTPFNLNVYADSNPLVHVMRTLGMFAVDGDPNARHDVAGLPLLGWPLGLLALVGLVRLWRRRTEPAHALVLVSLPVFLLPPLIAVEGFSPHFLRALGLAAPLGVTIGLGLVESLEQARRLAGRRVVLPAIVLAFTGFALLAAASGYAYLSRPVSQRYDAYSYDLAAVATLAKDGPADAVITDPYSATTIEFLAADPPTFVPPKTRIVDPGQFREVFAFRPSDLVDGLGLASSAAIRPVAWDPAGHPRAWAVMR